MPQPEYDEALVRQIDGGKTLATVMAMGMEKGRDVDCLLEMQSTKQKKDQSGCCLTVRQDSGRCLLVGWRTKLQTANLPQTRPKGGRTAIEQARKMTRAISFWRVAVEG